MPAMRSVPPWPQDLVGWPAVFVILFVSTIHTDVDRRVQGLVCSVDPAVSPLAPGWPRRVCLSLSFSPTNSDKVGQCVRVLSTPPPAPCPGSVWIAPPYARHRKRSQTRSFSTSRQLCATYMYISCKSRCGEGLSPEQGSPAPTVVFGSPARHPSTTAPT